MDCNSTEQKTSNKDWTKLTDNLKETWMRQRQHGLLCKDIIPKVVQYQECWECPSMTKVKVKVLEEKIKMLEQLCLSLQKSASVQVVHHQDMTERMAKLEADNLHLKQEENKTTELIIKLQEQFQQQISSFHIMDEKYIVSIRKLETENLHLKKEMENWISKDLQDKEIAKSHRIRDKENNNKLSEKILLCQQQVASCQNMEEKYMESLKNLETENLLLKEEMVHLRAQEIQMRERWNRMENLETMIKVMEHGKEKHEKEMSLMLQSLNKLEDFTTKLMEEKEREKNAKDGLNERETTEEREKKLVEKDLRKRDMVGIKEQEEERRVANESKVQATKPGADTERMEDKNTVDDRNDEKRLNSLGQQRRKKRAASKQTASETAQKTLSEDNIALTQQELQSTPAVSSEHVTKKKKRQTASQKLKEKEAKPIKMDKKKTAKEEQVKEEERKKALLIRKLEEARLKALEEVAAMTGRGVQN